MKLQRSSIAELFENHSKLTAHVQGRLTNKGYLNGWTGSEENGRGRRSAVLMALTGPQTSGDRGDGKGPCLIFNKRSSKVRQPGDLCFPGGGISPVDNFLYFFLRLPGMPLSYYAPMRRLRRSNPVSARRLSLLLATSLRESWEEMRLNPLRVKLLGALPAQKLSMFDHLIHPLVAWIGPERRFKPNWEVDRIVTIPLKKLIEPNNYALYRLAYKTLNGPVERDFPSFVHEDLEGTELLWGATFRITMDFLKIAFGFQPPRAPSLPVMQGRLGQRYLNGSRLSPGS